MKILLIDLGDTREELNEPLGIECIASRVVRDVRFQVDICWYNMGTVILPQQLYQYDCIGISMNIGTIKRFEEIYNMLKDKKSQLPLILGGCIPTFAYKQLIEKYENNICIYGEGEEAFYALVCKHIDGKLIISDKLVDIGNLAFKLNDQVIITQKKSLDLKRENPVFRDRDVLEYIKKNHGIVRLEGSRGCSWNKCSFCCVNAKYANPSWRGFPIDKILNELVELSEKGFHAPYFTDEDFFGQDYYRAIHLAQKIIELKHQGKIRKDMNFFISILVADAICEQGKKALVALKKAGLREVFLGIESLEKEQLKRYNKKASVDTNTKAIKFIDEIGLQIDSGYILFDPKMSFEALGANIDYIQNLKLNQFDSRSLKRLRIQPLTSISEEMTNVIVGELDINNLEYPYRFLDEKVEKVYQDYKSWEDDKLEDTWKVQSISRGEVDEKLRYELKLILGQIRDVDFTVLQTIYKKIKGGEISNLSTSIYKEQKAQKGQLIQQAFNLVENSF